MKLPETRIVEQVKNNGEKYYRAQFAQRFIFKQWYNAGWMSDDIYETLEEAKKAIDDFLEFQTESSKHSEAQKVVQTNYIKYP